MQKSAWICPPDMEALLKGKPYMDAWKATERREKQAAARPFTALDGGCKLYEITGPAYCPSEAARSEVPW